MMEAMPAEQWRHGTNAYGMMPPAAMGGMDAPMMEAMPPAAMAVWMLHDGSNATSSNGWYGC